MKINNVNNWSKINFGNSVANPISYAESFTVGDSDNPVKHLDLDLGDEGVSDYAFYFAKNLETVRVKGGSIGECAFCMCENLRHICIDADLLSKDSFDVYPSNLESVYSLQETPPAASDDTFAVYDGVKLYVPKGCVSEYENAAPCWWRFSNIYESDFSDLDSIFKADYVNNDGSSGVNEIFMNNNKNEVDMDSLYDVYDFHGRKLGNSIENLASGIYIIRQGNAQKKIAVK